MSNQNDALYQKWNDWIEQLDKEIRPLFFQRAIFDGVQSIIVSNPNLRGLDASFNLALSIWYTTSMSMAVRRLADSHKDVISYQNLLVGIKMNPKVITRTRFKQLFVDDSYCEDQANRCFDDLVGKGCEYIEEESIDAELTKLKDAVKAVGVYVDKRLAHWEGTSEIAVPTFGNLNSALDFLSDLHHKYYSLFRCVYLDAKNFTDFLTWKDVFRLPWIKSDETD